MSEKIRGWFDLTGYQLIEAAENFSAINAKTVDPWMIIYRLQALELENQEEMDLRRIAAIENLQNYV